MSNVTKLPTMPVAFIDARAIGAPQAVLDDITFLTGPKVKAYVEFRPHVSTGTAVLTFRSGEWLVSRTYDISTPKWKTARTVWRINVTAGTNKAYMDIETDTSDDGTPFAFLLDEDNNSGEMARIHRQATELMDAYIEEATEELQKLRDQRNAVAAF